MFIGDAKSGDINFRLGDGYYNTPITVITTRGGPKELIEDFNKNPHHTLEVVGQTIVAAATYVLQTT